MCSGNVDLEHVIAPDKRGIHQGSGKPENSQSRAKLRILDRFQTAKKANNSVKQVCTLNPIFSPTNQFSGINDV